MTADANSIREVRRGALRGVDDPAGVDGRTAEGTGSDAGAAEGRAANDARRRQKAKRLGALQRTSPFDKDLPLAPIETASFPALPQRSRKRNYGSLVSFVLCVVLPFLASLAYYFFYASDQYATGFSFTVRDAKSAAVSATGSSIGAQLGIGSSPNPLENYMVVEFLTSRQAVDEIQAKIGVRQRYSRPAIDWIARFDQSEPMEDFVAYWQRMVTASYDQITGIATAEIRAFSPEDTYLIATTLLSMSEELINDIAMRPQQDAIRFAEQDLTRAEDRLKLVSARLTEFRNTEQVIDPQSNVVSSNALLSQNLRTNLAQLRTELSSLQKQSLDPTSPVSQLLRSRIKATREQLAAVEAEIPKTRDGASSLSKVVGQYEQLDLDRQFAQEMVKLSMRALEDARASALEQHIYVTAFVRPALPQSSTYPKRITSVLVITFGCLIFWTVGLLFVRSVREHIS